MEEIRCNLLLIVEAQQVLVDPSAFVELCIYNPPNLYVSG